MAKVLLINPPWVIGENKNLWKHVASAWPSLGLGYIASVLLRDGHEVSYIDCSSEHYTVGDMEGILKNYKDPLRDNFSLRNEAISGENCERATKLCLEDKARSPEQFATEIASCSRKGYPAKGLKELDFVGITATTPLIKNGLAIAAIVRRRFPAAKIVFGGVHPSIMPDEVISDENVDFVVIDEGEETMSELVRFTPPAEILGLCYKDGGKIVKNPMRPLIQDLDSIPAPAYHLMPIKKYYPAIGSYKRLPAMMLFATRGCPGRCTFCYRTFRGVVRKRSARNIIDEIKILQKNYGIREVAFYDDTFTLFKDVVKEFCDIIKSEKIDIAWSCFTRVDHIDEELLRIMKSAGCHLILFGVESADETVLANIHKRISLDKVKEAVVAARRVGVETRASFMFGNEGETEETVKKTIDFAIELDPDEAQFNITTPYPGTEMFVWANANGYIKSLDWNDYSMSNVVFELPGLDKEKLEYYYKLAHRKFYFRPKVILRRLLRLRSWTTLKQEIKGALALGGFIYGD